MGAGEEERQEGAHDDDPRDLQRRTQGGETCEGSIGEELILDYAARADGDRGHGGQETAETEVIPSPSTEAIEPKAKQKPLEPSKDERDRHALTELPFRSWCESCVVGRGQSARHLRKRTQQSLAAPKIYADYASLRLKTVSAESGGQCLQVPVMVDSPSGAVEQTVTSAKAPVDWATRWAIDAIKQWGRMRVIVHVDHDPATIAWRDAVITFRDEETIPEEGARYDPQSHGGPRRTP